jgi:hypothetical protein
VPTVRQESENRTRTLGAQLVRINPEHPELETNGVLHTCSALSKR